MPVNLASQPIEHQQRLRRMVRIAAMSVAALTLVHAAAVWRLATAEAGPVVPVSATAELVRGWRDEVGRLAGAAQPRRAREVATAVAKANELIAERTFSWASLFAMLEEALPDQVRLELVQPATTPEGVRINLTAASSSPAALRSFLSALERRQEFEPVWPVRQQMGTDGQFRLTVVARHVTGGAGGQRP
ncbi:MAG: hypothetical protein ACE5HV_13650 [Acidobacteriota bacterium]